MKITFIATLLFITPAFAQQAPQAPTRESIIINALQAQRNQALDQVAVINAELQIVKRELDDLKAKAAPAKP